VKREVISLKQRVDKLEKTVATNNPSGTAKTAVSSFIDSLSANTIPMSARTIEICSIIAFFFIGVIIGASLIDRLWLIGGVTFSSWAAGAVHRDTGGGAFARKVGSQLALLIRDLQEKYNQAVIFYRTGKLAYMTSKVWEQYDKQLSITERLNTWRQLAIQRAASFNSSIEGIKINDQLADLWKVMQAAPINAKSFDRRYRLTSTLSNWGQKAYSNSKDLLSSLLFKDNDEERNVKRKKSRDAGRQSSTRIKRYNWREESDDNDNEEEYEDDYQDKNNPFQKISNGMSSFWSGIRSNMDKNGHRENSFRRTKVTKSNSKKKLSTSKPLVLSFPWLKFVPGVLGEKYRKEYEQQLAKHRRGRLINPWKPFSMSIE